MPLVIWPLHDPSVWPSWKYYVAQHTRAHELIGLGIVQVTVERITLTKDSNRRTSPTQMLGRTDFIFYRVDGSYVRVHPSDKVSLDAKLIFLQARAEVADAARHWVDSAPKPTDCIPQIDRLSNKKWWDTMTTIAPQLEATQEPMDITKLFHQLPWHLWMANMQRLRSIEVDQIVCVENTEAQKRFLIHSHTGLYTWIVTLRRQADRGAMKCEIVTQ